MRGSYKQGMRDDRWTEVDAAGKVTASGNRADLSEYLPLRPLRTH